MKLMAGVIVGALALTVVTAGAMAQAADDAIVVDHRYQPVPADEAIAVARRSLAVVGNWLADNTETGVCLITRANGGTEFTFLTIRNSIMAERTAVREQCGELRDTGSWRRHTTSDPIDGSSELYAWLGGRSLAGGVSWDAPPQFGLQCTDNTLGVYVDVDSYVGSLTDSVPVTYRIGEAVKSESWNELISGSNSSAGAWLPSWKRGDFIALVRNRANDEFVIRITGYDGEQFEARFDLAGFDVYPEMVLTECGW